MPNLIFKAADLLRVVDHSLAAPKQAGRTIDYSKAGKPITQPPAAPSVLLVHDQGVYLMSNGEPRDLIKGSKQSFVAYALGCDPRTDADWYDTAHHLVGGDDFGECLPWAAEIKLQLDAGSQQIIITISGDSIELQPLP